MVQSLLKVLRILGLAVLTLPLTSCTLLAFLFWTDTSRALYWGEDPYPYYFLQKDNQWYLLDPYVAVKNAGKRIMLQTQVLNNETDRASLEPSELHDFLVKKKTIKHTHIVTVEPVPAEYLAALRKRYRVTLLTGKNPLSYLGKPWDFSGSYAEIRRWDNYGHMHPIQKLRTHQIPRSPKYVYRLDIRWID